MSISNLFSRKIGMLFDGNYKAGDASIVGTLSRDRLADMWDFLRPIISGGYFQAVTEHLFNEIKTAIPTTELHVIKRVIVMQLVLALRVEPGLNYSKNDVMQLWSVCLNENMSDYRFKDHNEAKAKLKETLVNWLNANQ